MVLDFIGCYIENHSHPHCILVHAALSLILVQPGMLLYFTIGPQILRLAPLRQLYGGRALRGGPQEKLQ